MHDTKHRSCAPMPPGECDVKVAFAPAYLGTLTSRSRLCHAYADGTLLPVIAGGSIDTIEVEKPALLTVPEFAAEIRVAPSTAWAMVARGEIESIVIGQKMRRIPREALDAYIQARRAKTS